MIKQKIPIPLKNSPLYKLSSKKKLASLLGCSTGFLHKFQSSRGGYNKFSISKQNSNEKRPVEEPKKFLKSIHHKMKIILSAIEAPDYLKSGIKGKSHIDNAKAHMNNGNGCCVTIDLHHFYQTGRKTFLADMFMKTFKIVEDIAWLLADIITIPQTGDGEESYFPTGSPLSQLIIFWTYKKTFDEINEMSKRKGIIFTLYVDDMAFSSKNKIPKSFEKSIPKRIEKACLELNSNKTKRYSKTDAKIVTGCVVKKDKLAVRNKKREDVIELIKKSEDQAELSLKDIQRVIGKITSQQLVEPNFMEHTKKQFLSKQKHIKKKK